MLRLNNGERYNRSQEFDAHRYTSYGPCSVYPSTPALSPVDIDANTTTDNSGTATVTADEVKIGELIPQQHGGALRRGNPGNRGGTGRPPKEVQSRSRQLYERVLGELERTLEESGQALTPEQLVTVGNMAGRYAGLGEDVTHTITIGTLHLDALRAPRISATAQLQAPKPLPDTALADTVDTP